MAKEILIDTTDHTVIVFIPDPASTDGSGKTGLAHGDMTVSNTRVETDNDVVITDYTASLNALTNLTDAHNDWGWKEVSSTLAPGFYRLDIADAVFASGAWYSVLNVMITSSAAAASPIEFVLVAWNKLDGVRLGLTALPNAAADAAGGLIISDAGGLDADAQRADVAAILVDTGTTLDGRIPAALVGGRMDANVGAISSDATAADNAEAFFDGTGYAGTGNVIPSVTTVTGNVNGNVGGNVTGSVGSVATGGIAAASFAAGAIDAAAIATGAIDADAISADAVTEIQSGLATPTNITAGTITTVTNLTNAPTNGDLTATMKASVTTAATAATPTAAAVTGAVGSVTGNVGGNVTGSVGSVATGGIAAASFAAGAINAAAIATDAITDAEISAAACNKIADHTHRRNTSNIEASANGDTLAFKSSYGAIAVQTHDKDASSGTALLIKKSDNVTTLVSLTLTTDAAADPITKVNNS